MKKLILAFGIAASLLFVSCNEKKADTVKVGLLHSLSGTMSISETAVRDAELLAISELNESGGVLGKQIEVVQADGASDPQVFATQARKLLQDEKVATVSVAGQVPLERP